MKTLLIIFVLSVLIQSCIDSEQQRQAEEYQNFIDGLYKHTEKCRLPIDSTNSYSDCYIDFDKYISYFDELELDSNWVFEDVVSESMNGYVSFVSRKKSDTIAERIISNGKKAFKDNNIVYPDNFRDDYHNYRSSDSVASIYPFRINSTKGYFQLLILKLIGYHYCLIWHANYWVYDIITTKERLSQSLIKGKIFNDIYDRINYNPNLRSNHLPIDMPFSKKAKVLDINPYPIITEFKDSVNITITTFNSWEGYLHRSFSISKEFPHKISFIKSDTLVEYHCKILF